MDITERSGKVTEQLTMNFKLNEEWLFKWIGRIAHRVSLESALIK